MKKKLLFSFMCLVILLAAGCGSKEAVRSAEISLSDEKEAVPEITEREYTKEEILNLFYGYAYADPDERRALDCVVVTDDAYDLMGIVMFTTEEENECGFDYLRRDGTLAGHIGFEESPAENIQLEYLENGCISCQMQREDGSGYTCRILYTLDETGTDFTVETILEE